MLFNSYAFIFFFFPTVVVGYFALGRRDARAAAAFLALASLFFYGWWSIKAVPLLLASICFNYWAGTRLTPQGQDDSKRKRLLVISLAVNLTVLAIFKYSNFFIANINAGLAAANEPILGTLNVVLPIGISFYTFTQIAFLVDCWQGKVREPSFVHYALFVTFFPHLIAGPVLHHAQMMPQFANQSTYRLNLDKFALGLAIFTFGLAKKLLIGDRMGEYADMVFNGVQQGVTPTLGTAWFGVLAYTLQIYFDFSGYSDMAVGLSLCLGIRLPWNFNSPYKSLNIIEFWRRWHISLSNFLRDYLYIPLGGNRKGEARRYINLFLTMLLGGLWHGAAWTFVLWGALHGVYLVINHLWNKKFRRAGPPTRLARVAGWALTFLCVVVAWVVFRSESASTALTLYKSMLGLNGTSRVVFEEFTIPFRKPVFFQIFLVGWIICLACPATQTLDRWVPLPSRLAGRNVLVTNAATAAFAAMTVVMLGICVSRLGFYSPFLYFQF